MCMCAGSLWLVKEGTGATQCDIGKPIACGEIVRLEHVDSKKNLHSHLFRAPLSGNQEVSAFGDERGNGDTGDNWQVCSILASNDCHALWTNKKMKTIINLYFGMDL